MCSYGIEYVLGVDASCRGRSRCSSHGNVAIAAVVLENVAAAAIAAVVIAAAKVL